MKTHRKLFSSCAAFALAVAAFSVARADVPTVRVAPETSREQTAAKLTGQKVFARNGESLGTVKDFVIAAPKGAPVYAVVSAGGMLGMGNTLRLVPTNALEPQVARGADGFVLPLDAPRWNLIAPIDAEGYQRGYLRLTAQQHAELGAPFRDVEGFKDVRLDDDAQLIRASELRRKEIHAGNEEVGEIEGVVIDLRASHASVLLETEDDFAGSERLVLVPMNKFTFTSSKNDRIITSLTRDDFVQMHTAAVAVETDNHVAQTRAMPADRAPHADVVDNTPQPRQPAVVSDGSLTPTGRDVKPQSREELLEIGARSVRDLIRAQPAYRNADIDVKADYGKIVLSGHAPSEQLRAEIYDTAKGATGFDVLNNIVVKPDRR